MTEIQSIEGGYKMSSNRATTFKKKKNFSLSSKSLTLLVRNCIGCNSVEVNIVKLYDWEL